MSASFNRPSALPQQMRASLKITPPEKALTDGLLEAEQRLVKLQNAIVFRVDNDAPAADHAMLDDMRRIADEIKAVADRYQWGAS